MKNYTKKGTNAENFKQISLLLKKIWYLKDSRNGHFAMHYSSFNSKQVAFSLVPVYFHVVITHEIITFQDICMDKLPKDFTSTKDTYYAALIHLKISSNITYP